MLSQQHIFNENYRSERSAEIAAACDITENSISLVYYDLALKRRYARTVLVGERISVQNIRGLLTKLIVTSVRGYGIPASAVKALGVAAPVHIESFLERSLLPEELYLPPGCDIFFVPFISAGISGRFTASLLTLHEDEYVAADFGRTFCVARKDKDKTVCAAFPLNGAFDGSGLESGMPAENGAVDIVRRQPDGTIVYEVVGDAESIGISPCAALMAVREMLSSGVVDSDGIMTDRDLLYIGEDLFISQSDVRVLQADKAYAHAALELFSETEKAYFCGEPFSTAEGLKALLAIGAVPEKFRSAAFCRGSVEQGIILCLEDEENRKKAVEIARNAIDATTDYLPKFDEVYLNYLMF